MLVHRKDYHEPGDSFSESSTEEYGTYDYHVTANECAWGLISKAWDEYGFEDEIIDLGTEREGSDGFRAPNPGLKEDCTKGKYLSKTGNIRYTERENEYMDWVVVLKESDRSKRSAEPSSSSSAPSAKRKANVSSITSVAGPHIWAVVSRREYESVGEKGEVDVHSLHNSQARANETASERFREEIWDADEPADEVIEDYGLGCGREWELPPEAALFAGTEQSRAVYWSKVGGMRYAEKGADFVRWLFVVKRPLS